MFVVMFMLIIYAYVGLSQDCRMSGESCHDSAGCCGGCCIANACIDTTEMCYESPNCLTHYCPGGMECYMYHVPNCLGCEVAPQCRPAKN